MKKLVFTLVVMCSSLMVNGQESEKKATYGLISNAKLGFAKLKQSEMVRLNGTVNYGDVQFFYSLPSGVYFSGGIGLLEFNANGVIEGNSYALEQNHLRIPVYVGRSVSIFKEATNNKISVYGGVGIYANTLLKEEVQTLEKTVEDSNLGWNMGLGFNVGMLFEVGEGMSFGVGFDTQSDVTKMKQDGVSRRLENINTVSFTYKQEF